MLIVLSFIFIVVADASAEDSSDEEMVITGTRTEKPRGESPVPVEVISRDDIIASGAEDLAELLEDHPGVDLQRGVLGASLRLQGLEPEHVLILVDGVRTVGRKDGVLDLSRYPIEEIERVEIVKGAGSALHGSDALGGVINIVTRRPSRGVSAQSRARYGAYNTADVTAGVSLGHAVRLTGGWHQTDGWDLDPSDLTTNGSARRGFEGAGRGRIALGANADVDLRAGYTRRNPQRVSESASGAVFDQQNLTEEVMASVSPVLTPGRLSKLTLLGALSFFRDQYQSDQRGSTELDQLEDSRQQLLQTSAQYDQLIGRRHLVTLGVEGLFEGIDAPRLSDVGSRQRIAVFAQEDWTLSDRLELLLGLRWDMDSQFGEQLSPKLSARWAPWRVLVLRGGYGRGFRAPSFRELLLRFENPGVGYVVTGSPDLRPERSHNLTLDAELSFASDLSLNASGYMNWVDDLIVVDLVSDDVGLTTFGYENISSAWTRGGESQLRWTPGRLNLTLGYAFTDTFDVEAERALPGRPRHRGTVSARWRWERLRTNLSGRASLVGPGPLYVDLDGDDVEETIETDPYASVDCRLSRDFGAHIGAFAGVNNALNAGNTEFVNLTPRLIYGGLTARY
ncbi:MAG: TonB-dependent receptor [Myxococcota bacterium]